MNKMPSNYVDDSIEACDTCKLIVNSVSHSRRNIVLAYQLGTTYLGTKS